MSTYIRKEADKVPEPTLRRLPWYLSNIKLMKDKGEQYVSSTQISKEINIDASQIAKDLSYVNISGRTRVGYNIDALIEVLESFLGFTNMHKAFLFGVGSLGAALLRDSGLHHFGLEIVAAFDVNPELVGKDLNGIPIFHSDDFEAKMKEYDVNIGVLTVPINILGYTDSERSKVPYGFYTSVYHLICNFLSNINRHGQHTDIYIVFFHLCLKIIRVKNRNTIQVFSHQFRIHIKSCHNLQPEMMQT